MIGNDVIDLELSATQSNWRRKGFLEKVYTASEREQITRAKDPAVMVWLLWSMKEAAYKAHQREYKHPRKLNWHRQECEVTKFDGFEASGVVKIEPEEYFSNSAVSSGAIFTSAVKDKNTGFKNALFISSSEVMRKEFLKEASDSYNLPLNSLQLQKNNEGIPFLMYHEQEHSCAFSFTEHGRFSAFSIALTNC